MQPSDKDTPETITEVSVSEISLERRGTLPKTTEPKAGSTVSRVALGLGVFSILFAPVLVWGPFRRSWELSSDT